MAPELCFGELRGSSRVGVEVQLQSGGDVGVFDGQLPAQEQLGVVVFGNQSQQLENLLPFKVYPLNFVSNEHQLVNIYNAVDIFVTPSLEENLPNTIMEAMACGTPCVGFNIGGIPEMIRPGETGFLAKPHDAEELGRGICDLLARGGAMRAACAAFARAAYAPESVARRHLELYRSLLEPQ